MTRSNLATVFVALAALASIVQAYLAWRQYSHFVGRLEEVEPEAK